MFDSISTVGSSVRVLGMSQMKSTSYPMHHAVEKGALLHRKYNRGICFPLMYIGGTRSFIF